MGSLNADVCDQHHHAEQCQWSYSRRDERQKAQRGGGDGRSGPHDPMRAQHGNEQEDRGDPGGRADLHNECPESKPGRADPSAPARASVQLSLPIARMTRRFPRATTKNARPTMVPAAQVSTCLRASRAGSDLNELGPLDPQQGSATAPGRSEERVSHSEHLNDLG